MNEKTQREMFDFLLNNGIENFLGVPDSTVKYFIEQGLKKNKIIITTKEEEAIGIAVGMYLSGSSSIVFMQNAGLGNSISTITSLVQLYKTPIIFLIGWRGYLNTDAPEHKKFGKIQPRLLRLLGIKSKVIQENNWKRCCIWALKEIKKNNPCVLTVPRDFHD